MNIKERATFYESLSTTLERRLQVVLKAGEFQWSKATVVKPAYDKPDAKPRYERRYVLIERGDTLQSTLYGVHTHYFNAQASVFPDPFNKYEVLDAKTLGELPVSWMEGDEAFFTSFAATYKALRQPAA